MKLHEINDSTSKKSLAKYLIHIIIQCLFLIALLLVSLDGVQEKYVFIAHLKHFVLMLYFLIFLPKYYIHQNPSLKIYVKYYHYQLGRTKPLKVLSPSLPLKKGTTGDCPLFIPGK
jgi:hypothetical protein